VRRGETPRSTGGRIPDSRHARRPRGQRPPRTGRAADLLGALGRDALSEEGRDRRPRRRLRRTNRGVPSIYEARSHGGDCLAANARRGWWSPSEAAPRPSPPAWPGDRAVPEGSPGGDLKGPPGDAGLPPRRWAPTLCSNPSTALRVALRFAGRLTGQRAVAVAQLFPWVPAAAIRARQVLIRLAFAGKRKRAGVERQRLARKVSRNVADDH